MYVLQLSSVIKITKPDIRKNNSTPIHPYLKSGKSWKELSVVNDVHLVKVWKKITSKMAIPRKLSRKVIRLLSPKFSPIENCIQILKLIMKN